LHFSDEIICLISSALVGGNVHKLGKDNKKVIKSCRVMVNFGGYNFASFGKMFIQFFTMVLIIRVSIVGFCTYFAFFCFCRNNFINNFPVSFDIISAVFKF